MKLRVRSTLGLHSKPEFFPSTLCYVRFPEGTEGDEAQEAEMRQITKGRVCQDLEGMLCSVSKQGSLEKFFFF